MDNQSELIAEAVIEILREWRLSQEKESEPVVKANLTSVQGTAGIWQGLPVQLLGLLGTIYLVLTMAIMLRRTFTTKDIVARRQSLLEKGTASNSNEKESK